MKKNNDKKTMSRTDLQSTMGGRFSRSDWKRIWEEIRARQADYESYRKPRPLPAFAPLRAF